MQWCRRRVRFNEVPEKVPEKVPKVPEKVWEALVQRVCGHLTHGNPAEVFPALGFATRFRQIFKTPHSTRSGGASEVRKRVALLRPHWNVVSRGNYPKKYELFQKYYNLLTYANLFKYAQTYFPILQTWKPLREDSGATVARSTGRTVRGGGHFVKKGGFTKEFMEYQ